MVEEHSGDLFKSYINGAQSMSRSPKYDKEPPNNSEQPSNHQENSPKKYAEGQIVPTYVDYNSNPDKMNNDLKGVGKKLRASAIRDDQIEMDFDDNGNYSDEDNGDVEDDVSDASSDRNQKHLGNKTKRGKDTPYMQRP